MRANQTSINCKTGRYSHKAPLLFPHICVVEASAGSGKTRRLVQRYVDFLLHYSGKSSIPFSFRNVLAVTFTNEAANQMKQEILKMLKVCALSKGRDSLIARQIVDEIIQNFSDFTVRTIDSFVHSLLVALSLELKLPPDYEIQAQPRAYLEYVLDTLLDEVIYDQGIAKVFLEFLNHFLVVEEQRYWSPKKILLSLLSKFYLEENGRAKLFKQASWNVDLNQVENDLKDQLSSLLTSLMHIQDVNQRFQKGLESLLNHAGPVFIKSLSHYIDRSLTPGEGILNKQASSPPLELIQHWDRLRRQYNNYARAFVWLRYSSYLNIYNRFRERLEDFKRQERIVFLDELNKKAREFLTSQGFLPAEIYYKLSSVLYHYLIDEFQDTSLLQWENIQALVEDALSKGGSLFYVGDKKQAIYRFRGGEVELFDLIKDRFKNQVAKIYDEVLLYNYRSEPAIIEFNNSVFSHKNLRDFLDNFTLLSKQFQERILAVFRDSQQKKIQLNSGAGYVRVELLEAKTQQQVQDHLNIKLKETVVQLRERFNYQDILILVRDNQEAGGLASFLLSEQIPVCTSRTISIRQNYLMRQIICLLKFLHSPIDNLCFANFILGDIFSSATKLSTARLQGWLEGLRIEADKELIPAGRRTNKQSNNHRHTPILYTLFRLHFPDIWQEFLQCLFNTAGFLPVYDLVTSILIRFKIEENFPYLAGFSHRLLEILNNLEAQGRTSLADFLAWFEDADDEDLLVELPSGLEAVKILTIHKAKGLSSAVVILPYTTLDIKVGEACRVVCEQPEGLYLLYLQKDICRNHPDLASIYQREYFQALLDELNCLYVGFTRAVKELYIFVPGRINRGRNPLIPLLFNQTQDSRLQEFGNKIIYPHRPKPLTEKWHTKAKTRIKQPPESWGILPQERFKHIFKDQPSQPKPIIASEKRYLVNRGKILHYLLAEIDFTIFTKDPSIYNQSIKDACRIFNYSNYEEITQCLYSFYRDPNMQRFFNPQLKAINEQEIVDQYGNLKRIDRLVFMDDKILVIDYKTGQEYEQEHQQQVSEYMRILEELYPGKVLQGWLIYVDTRASLPL